MQQMRSKQRAKHVSIRSLWILKDKQMHPVSGNIWAMWTDILPQALRSLISFCLPSCYSQLTEWSLSWWCGTPAHVRYCTSQLASVQTIQSMNRVMTETLVLIEMTWCTDMMVISKTTFCWWLKKDCPRKSTTDYIFILHFSLSCHLHGFICFHSNKKDNVKILLQVQKFVSFVISLYRLYIIYV